MPTTNEDLPIGYRLELTYEDLKHREAETRARVDRSLELTYEDLKL